MMNQNTEFQRIVFSMDVVETQDGEGVNMMCQSLQQMRETNQASSVPTDKQELAKDNTANDTSEPQRACRRELGVVWCWSSSEEMGAPWFRPYNKWGLGK